MNDNLKRKLLQRIHKKRNDPRIRQLAAEFIPRLNLGELSEATGLGRSTLCRILQGQRHKNTYTLLLVALALEINLEDFIYILETRRDRPVKNPKQEKVIFHGQA